MDDMLDTPRPKSLSTFAPCCSQGDQVVPDSVRCHVRLRFPAPLAIVVKRCNNEFALLLRITSQIPVEITACPGASGVARRGDHITNAFWHLLKFLNTF